MTVQLCGTLEKYETAGKHTENTYTKTEERQEKEQLVPTVQVTGEDEPNILLDKSKRGSECDKET